MKDADIHLRTCCMGSSPNINSAAQAAGGRPVIERQILMMWRFGGKRKMYEDF